MLKYLGFQTSASILMYCALSTAAYAGGNLENPANISITYNATTGLVVLTNKTNRSELNVDSGCARDGRLKASIEKFKIDLARAIQKKTYVKIIFITASGYTMDLCTVEAKLDAETNDRKSKPTTVIPDFNTASKESVTPPNGLSKAKTAADSMKVDTPGSDGALDGQSDPTANGSAETANPVSRMQPVH